MRLNFLNSPELELEISYEVDLKIVHLFPFLIFSPPLMSDWYPFSPLNLMCPFLTSHLWSHSSSHLKCTSWYISKCHPSFKSWNTYEASLTSLVNKIRYILELRAYILKLNFFITYFILYNAFCHKPISHIVSIRL